MLAPSGTTQTFALFLKHLRHRSGAFANHRIYLVIDNLNIHYANLELIESLNFVPLFQPAYSPSFNSIETLWGMLKRKVRIRLLESNHDLSDKQFQNVLDTVCKEITPFMQRKGAATFNRKYMH